MCYGEAEVEDGEETVDIEEQIKPFLFETEKELMAIAMRLKRACATVSWFSSEIKDAGASRKPEYSEKRQVLSKASHVAPQTL